ncbi:DUF6157 family protein [Methylobacterium dankookense]|uniref:Uncharacterized protein n=1 Tax=Methylobacterium dankookense TaxID=560405 RepID=A0A564G427_9HYPH|nr:DUF6157 family protein [Methylobacterium dankookense]GJD58923.1 hypothetical protein IFDJLNFL_4849 [Methylobacterium dankookense]VUF15263.1 hypothetical protein MTDSW087_04999 [Methylobacterium dankookense]
MRTIRNSFVLVGADCPVTASVIPQTRGGAPTVPALQHMLLSADPYRYDHEGLIWEVYRHHKAIPPADEVSARASLFSRSHPCMRASILPKRYGWGVHYDEAGRIAIVGMETGRYRELAASEPSMGITVVRAMRSKRAREVVTCLAGFGPG